MQLPFDRNKIRGAIKLIFLLINQKLLLRTSKKKKIQKGLFIYLNKKENIMNVLLL
jgi:hypothetical protein